MNAARRLALTLASRASLATLAAAACNPGDLVVGDDSTALAPEPDTGPPPPPSPDADPPGPPPDGGADASPATDASDDAPGPDSGCPILVPPAPSFCDGGPYAPTYNPATGCTNGYACTPADCLAAGGTCVGIVPGACPTGTIGSAVDYSCGSGIGVACCLP